MPDRRGARCAWLRVVAGRRVSAILSGSFGTSRARARFSMRRRKPRSSRGGDQAVNARLGLEVQGFLHLIKRGRNAGFPDALVDEHQQLILLAG